MKQFKNTFGVTGSAKQLEAFAEWAEGVGWKSASHTPTLNAISFSGERGTFLNCHATTAPYYSLPSQWSEAMAAASEVEETVFEVGKKYMENIYGTVVLCTDYSKECIQGVCIVPSERHELGEFRTKWCKQVFTPYNEPVTI